MNRKRDLENLSSLYEEGFGANVLPSRSRPNLRTKPTYGRAQGPQMDAIKALNKIGWSVNKERTKIDGIPNNEVLLSKNVPRSKEEADMLVYVDQEGNINGQPYQAAIADLEEDEQSSALGQELADKEEDQNPVQNLESYDEDYETTEGKFATYTTKPSLDDIRRGVGLGDNIKRGKIVQDLGKTVLVDIGNSFIELSKDELDSISREENAEDLGPNQEPESWGDEAMGDEQPGETSARFSQDTPDDPASGGSPHIDDPDEEEYDDPYYNREEDLRSRGIDSDAEDPDADEKGKEERNHEDEEMSLQKALEVIKQHMHSKNKYGDDYDIEDESLNFGDREKAMKVYIKNFNKKINKESYSSHGDRDMSLLAENYLNIKNYE